MPYICSKKIWNVLVKLRKTFCGSITKNCSKAHNEKKIWHKENNFPSFPSRFTLLCRHLKYCITSLNTYYTYKWSLFKRIYIMIGNSVTFFGLINKYFLTTFYFIEFLALLYIFKWSLFAKCIVLNKFYRESSNNSPAAYLPTKIFWVGAYSSGGGGGAYLNGGLINLEELRILNTLKKLS